jgi:fructose-bisphosphate aldolase class II
MPLVTSKEILQKAQAEGYAVGAFNANNMEFVQAVVETAEEEQSPVILQISQGAIAYAGLEFASMLVKTAAELATVPVVLHLDHGTDFLQNVRCLRAGFTSLMFDGSSLPLEENIATTRKITEIAHAVGIPVEAELGKIPKIEDNLTQEQVDNLMADPEQAERFVSETQCDSLAAAIGSVHGMKESIQPLNIARLDEIRRRTGVPIVLHGASGVLCTRKDAEEKGIKLADYQGTLEDAIKHGVSKINVATELSMAFLRGMKEAFEAKPNEKDMRKILLPGKNAVKEVVRYYIRLFGSNGKAKSSTTSGLQSSEIKYHE